MKNISKIKLNLVKEKLYIESMVNQLYEDIASYGEDGVKADILMESLIKEEEGKSIISDIVDEFKLAPKFIFTFGTGITAFYEPIVNLLNNSGFELNEYQVYLLIITAIASIIGESDTQGLVDKIKEEGLFSALETIKEFILNTEKLLKEITKKSLGAAYVISDILAFTSLLVPTMNIMNETINTYGISKSTLTGLFKGIILATVTYSVKSVINRIKNKLN